MAALFLDPSDSFFFSFQFVQLQIKLLGIFVHMFFFFFNVFANTSEQNGQILHQLPV